MAEPTPRDQDPLTSTPINQSDPASSAGSERPDGSAQVPQAGRGGGRGQKAVRGRGQRTPPPGRNQRRPAQGPEGRPKNHLQPGRRAGSVVNLKESFGFVKVHGVPDNLFFHVSEVVPPEPQDGQSRLELQKTLFPGDHVEFDIVRSDRDPGAFIAKQVKKVDPPSATPASSEAANGHAIPPYAVDTPSEAAPSTPPGGLEWRMARPAGQAPSPKQPASLARELGIVASIKNNFGFIRCAEREGRLFFRLGVHEKVQQEQFRIGLEVSFRVILDENTRKHVAIEIELAEPGTLTAAMNHTEALEGVVMQPPGARPQEEGDGVISFTSSDERPCSVPYDSFVVAGEEAPGVNDRVTFNLALHEATGISYATRVSVLEKVAPRSEFGKVSVLKNNFGFIKACERAADLMFHAEGLEGLSIQDLKEGDEVEFEVAHKPHQASTKPHQPSKLCAVRVRKAAPGSAVFEVVEEEVLQGVVVDRLVLGKGGLTISAGILEHGPPGCTARLVFTAEDLQEAGVNPLAGSAVTFQQAVKPQVAASAARGGGSLATHAGRHATKVQAKCLAGTVASVKGQFGFIDFREEEEMRHIFFHATGVEGEVTLRVGDEVTFVVLDRGKNKELVACKIVRTKEAPPAPEKEAAKPPKELVAETNPNRMVFTGTAKPGMGRGNQVVRLARGPDGTKGFAPGRGKLLPPGSLPPASPGAPTPPVLLRRSPAPGSEGGKAGKKGGAGRDTPKDPTPAKTKGLVKTASGKLRASAAEFIPRISSDNSLSQQPSGSLPDAASVAASSAPNISILHEPTPSAAASSALHSSPPRESLASAAASGAHHNDDASEPANLSNTSEDLAGMHAPGLGDELQQEAHASMTETGRARQGGTLLMAQDQTTYQLPDPMGFPAHEPALSAGAAAPPERVVGFTEPALSQADASPQKHSLAAHAAAAAPYERTPEGTEQEPRNGYPNAGQNPPSRSVEGSQPAISQPSGNAATPDPKDGGSMTNGASAAIMDRDLLPPQGALPGLCSSAGSPDSIRHPHENGGVHAQSSKSRSHPATQAGANGHAHGLTGSGESPADAAEDGSDNVMDMSAERVPAAL